MHMSMCFCVYTRSIFIHSECNLDTPGSYVTRSFSAQDGRPHGQERARQVYGGDLQTRGANSARVAQKMIIPVTDQRPQEVYN